MCTFVQQPLEIIARRHFITSEVHSPEAVDVFGLGCTMFFVLSSGREAFGSQEGEEKQKDAELNILSGQNSIDRCDNISYEGKHVIKSMLHPMPNDRCTLEDVLRHPLFWTLEEKVKYIGEMVGSALPVKIHKSQNKIISELELAMDAHLGAYNEFDPDESGSWSRLLNTRYPLTGDWGKSGQRSPTEEEHNYYIFGAPPKQKQAAERARQLKSGHLTSTFAPKV